LKLIYKFRTQTPAKRKLIAIWGSGTLGGAIIDEFKNHGYDIIEQNFSWVREDKQKTQLNMILEKIADICKNRCTEIHLIWAAGNTSFFSKAFDLKRETRALKLICEYFGRQCHFNKLSLHVHFMSSAGALFEGHRLIKDDTRPDPKNLYGMNKSQQEALLKRLIGRYCSVNIYRPSTVYGPSNNKQREGLILAIVKNSLQRRPTRYYAKMDTLRDYVFNLDIARYVVRRVEQDLKGVFTTCLASGKPSTLEEINKEVTLHIGVKPNIFFGFAAENAANITFSPSAIDKTFEATSLSTGIGITIKHHRTKLFSIF
jgi:hypothetical protein